MWTQRPAPATSDAPGAGGVGRLAPAPAASRRVGSVAEAPAPARQPTSAVPRPSANASVADDEADDDEFVDCVSGHRSMAAGQYYGAGAAFKRAAGGRRRATAG